MELIQELLNFSTHCGRNGGSKVAPESILTYHFSYRRSVADQGNEVKETAKEAAIAPAGRRSVEQDNALLSVPFCARPEPIEIARSSENNVFDPLTGWKRI